MQLLDKAGEERVMRLLKEAKHDVGTGTHPSDAIYKVASANGVTPPFVQRMVESLNTALTLEHLKTAGAAKGESFPIASAENIIGRMYPDQVEAPNAKAASEYVPAAYNGFKEKTNFNVKAADFALPPLTTKKVEAYAQDPNIVYAKLASKKRGLDKQASDAGAFHKGRMADLLCGIDKVASYFSNTYHTPFAEVEERVVSKFGEDGKRMMDLLYANTRNEKRAENNGHQRVRAFPATQEPYVQIDALMKLAQLVVDSGSDVLEAELAARAFSKQHGMPVPFSALYEKKAEAVDEIDAVLVPFEKAAIDPATLALVGGMNMMGLKEPSDNLRRTAALDASDPTHESELNSIKVKSMLNDLVSNDPVLSMHEPHEVFNAYNSLAGMSPQAAQQPALMRGALRRMLQQEGVMEPFEAHQMGQIEKGLRGLSTPGIKE